MKKQQKTLGQVVPVTSGCILYKVFFDNGYIKDQYHTGNVPIKKKQEHCVPFIP